MSAPPRATTRVRLYTSDFCEECDRARGLLERRGVPFEEVNLNAAPSLPRPLRALTGGASVPQVVVDGAPIGGYADLVAFDRSGRLEPLREDVLASVPA